MPGAPIGSSATWSPTLSVPRSIRPIPIRPRKVVKSRVEISIWNGPFASLFGGGTYARIVSNSGARSGPGCSSSVVAVPCRLEVYRNGASSCSWLASRSMNSPSTSSCTRSGSASGRSILLITTIGRRPSASAFRVTNRVCGIGPSAASTRISTPSTIRRMRSTSPPKSACPGVSTMLILTPFQRTAVFLARMVMPRSRSSGLESMTRSSTC